MASTTSAAASMLMSGSTTNDVARTAGIPNFLAAHQFLGSPSSVFPFAKPTSYPSITLDLTKEPATQLSLRLGGPTSAPAFQSYYEHKNQQTNPQMCSRKSGLPSLHSFGKVSNMSSPENHASMATSINSSLINVQAMHQQVVQEYLSGEMEKFVHLGQNLAATPELAYSLVKDSVSAATAAITADPKFTAALAAAITSMVLSHLALGMQIQETLQLNFETSRQVAELHTFINQ